MAACMGINASSEPHRLWLAKRAVYGRLPQPWVLLLVGPGGERLFYYNFATGERTTRHPALGDLVEMCMLLRRPVPPPRYRPTPYDDDGKTRCGKPAIVLQNGTKGTTAIVRPHVRNPHGRFETIYCAHIW